MIYRLLFGFTALSVVVVSTPPPRQPGAESATGSDETRSVARAPTLDTQRWRLEIAIPVCLAIAAALTGRKIASDS